MKKILLVILLLTISTSVYASDNTKEASVRNDFNVVLNNEEIKLNNDIITIDGVSYLPLREISSLLGLNVSYEKGVIYLESTQEKEVGISMIERKIQSINWSAEEINKTIAVLELWKKEMNKWTKINT